MKLVDFAQLEDFAERTELVETVELMKMFLPPIHPSCMY